MCAILISQVQNETFFVLGETFLRNFYVNLDFSSDKQQYIYLAPTSHPPQTLVDNE